MGGVEAVVLDIEPEPPESDEIIQVTIFTQFGPLIRKVSATLLDREPHEVFGFTD